MAQLDPVVFREIPVVQKIIRDEMWFEGERRGCSVTPDDPVVRDNVCQIVLRLGATLRETILAQIAADPGPAMRPLTGPHHGEAA